MTTDIAPKDTALVNALSASAAMLVRDVERCREFMERLDEALRMLEYGESTAVLVIRRLIEEHRAA